MKALTGNCLCGATKYTCVVDSITTVICHCDDCQRNSGSVFSTCVLVPRGTAVFDDSQSLGEYVSKADSGQDVKRVFCKKCGSPLLSQTESAPDLDIIKAGSLNDKSVLTPAAQYWCDSALQWSIVGSDVPKFERSS